MAIETRGAWQRRARQEKWCDAIVFGCIYRCARAQQRRAQLARAGASLLDEHGEWVSSAICGCGRIRARFKEEGDERFVPLGTAYVKWRDAARPSGLHRCARCEQHTGERERRSLGMLARHVQRRRAGRTAHIRICRQLEQQ